jgi:hypothetical protein
MVRGMVFLHVGNVYQSKLLLIPVGGIVVFHLALQNLKLVDREWEANVLCVWSDGGDYSPFWRVCAACSGSSYPRLQLLICVRSA